VGKGATHGTKVHSEFATSVNALKKPDVRTEVSYKNGREVPRGTAGSVRVDVVRGPPNKPSAIFDLKTGQARLTPKPEQKIRQQLPKKSKNVPIVEVR
jgi:hypothetical protein